MSLNLLLEAVDFVEKRDSVTCASPERTSSPVQPKPLYKTIWSRNDDESQFYREFTEDDEMGQMRLERGTREVHNKLEKNRRAHLKGCFETIQQLLPPGQDNRKQSHLSILHNAIKYIQVLRRKDREFEHEMERLARDKIALQQRLGQLKKELNAVYDNVDFNVILPEEPGDLTGVTSVKDEPDPVETFRDPKCIPADAPKMISFTSRLEPANLNRTPAGHLATALLSPLQLVTSSPSVRVLPKDASTNKRELDDGRNKRYVTISSGAFQTKNLYKPGQPPNGGVAHVVTSLATTHATLYTPVTVLSQGDHISQIITAPSSKLVTPFNMKPIMSQYLVKHGSAVVVRNQTSAITQTISK